MWIKFEKKQQQKQQKTQLSKYPKLCGYILV